MIETLISSKTRIKLLLKFFLNSTISAHLRGLETEFGESSNAIRVELNRLEKAGMLNSEPNGNKKLYRVNNKHPLFTEVRSIVFKFVGIDKIIEVVVQKLGDPRLVYLTGELARGSNSNIIDLVFVGNIDKNYLINLVEKAEKIINRKIRFVVYSQDEFAIEKISEKDFTPLLIWSKG